MLARVRVRMCVCVCVRLKTMRVRELRVVDGSAVRVTHVCV